MNILNAKNRIILKKNKHSNILYLHFSYLKFCNENISLCFFIIKTLNKLVFREENDQQKVLIYVCIHQIL